MKKVAIFSIFLSLISAISAVLIFGGCGSFPKDEMNKATEALKKAKEAEANIYAESLFMAAYNAFSQTKTYVTDRKWKTVKKLALKSVALSEKAIEAVPSAKVEYKAKAIQLISQMDSMFNECSLFVDKNSKRKRLNEIQLGQQKKDEQFLAKAKSFKDMAKENYIGLQYRKTVEFAEQVIERIKEFDKLHKKTTNL